MQEVKIEKVSTLHLVDRETNNLLSDDKIQELIQEKKLLLLEQLHRSFSGKLNRFVPLELDLSYLYFEGVESLMNKVRQSAEGDHEGILFTQLRESVKQSLIKPDERLLDSFKDLIQEFDETELEIPEQLTLIEKGVPQYQVDRPVTREELDFKQTKFKVGFEDYELVLLTFYK